MLRAQEMLRTHPKGAPAADETLAACIQQCFDCAQTCISCADACLGEDQVAQLRRCVRLNEDCKTACLATGEMLSRVTEASWDHLGRQVEACLAACRECAAECERHSAHMEHCRICAEACRRCEAACDDLLRALAA